MSFSVNPCGVCSKNIVDNNYGIGLCGHTYHDICWKGACNPCEAARKLREKQISRENWTIVAQTLVIIGVCSAFFIRR